MAKKKTTKKTTATGKTTKTKAAKKPAAAGSKKATEQIALDPIEQEAFKLAHSSKAVCRELELSVSDAICQAVRKVFKQHKVVLSQEQGETVSFVLFGD